MKKTTGIIFALVLSACICRTAAAHCEMPCGIYDDEARIEEIKGHITTIEKSIDQIQTLEAEGEKNYNQIVRWVITKEEHAHHIQEIVQQYFLTQRIKPKDVSDDPSYAKYVKELSLLHQMLIYAMKTKQTLDTTYTDMLRSLVDQFSESYFAKM